MGDKSTRRDGLVHPGIVTMNDSQVQTEPVPLLLLDRQKMAAAICVSEDTLDGMRKKGCPSIPVPGTRRILFDPADVIRWLKESEDAHGDTETLRAAKERADIVFGKRSA